MYSILAFSVLAVFIIQSYGLEDPSPDKVAEYRRMVAEWSEEAVRIARSLENRPQDDADGVTAQLKAAMDDSRRHKRDGVIDKISDAISDAIEKAKHVASDLESKGKELAGDIQGKVKDIQSKMTH